MSLYPKSLSPQPLDGICNRDCFGCIRFCGPAMNFQGGSAADGVAPFFL